MISFIKKHPIFVLLLLTPFVTYVYFYFTSFRYEKDRYDKRYYPITLTEKWSKTIEYKTLPKVKFWKCFLLEVNGNQMLDKVGERYYSEVYNYKYSRTWGLSDEEFLNDIQEKPRFLLQIYKDDMLVQNEIIYMAAFYGSYAISIEGKEIKVKGIVGQTQSRRDACYGFDEDSYYKIVLTNEAPTNEFQGVDTYLSIKPVFFGK